MVVGIIILIVKNLFTRMWHVYRGLYEVRTEKITVNEMIIAKLDNYTVIFF